MSTNSVKISTNVGPQSDIPKLPYGHISVNVRWKGHAMLAELRNQFTVIFSDEFEFIDFIPSQSNIISVLTEEEILENNDENLIIRNKMARIYKLVNKYSRNSFRAMLVYHHTPVTQPFFNKIQSLSMIDFSMAMIPMSDLLQVPDLLDRCKVASRAKNIFKVNRSIPARHSNKDVLICLLGLPGVKEAQARKLASKFGSVRSLALASKQEIASVVGEKVASAISMFLDRTCSY